MLNETVSVIFKHRGWVRIIIGYVLICFWSWCSSLNSKAWVSERMWEFSGYKWNFATISFHDFHTERFFPPSLSSYWIHFFGSRFFGNGGTTFWYSSSTFYSYRWCQSISWMVCCSQSLFCAKMHTILFAMITISFSVTKVFHTNNNSNKECFWSRKLLNLCMSQEKTCRV